MDLVLVWAVVGMGGLVGGGGVEFQFVGSGIRPGAGAKRQAWVRAGFESGGVRVGGGWVLELGRRYLIFVLSLRRRAGGW